MDVLSTGESVQWNCVEGSWVLRGFQASQLFLQSARTPAFRRAGSGVGQWAWFGALDQDADGRAHGGPRRGQQRWRRESCGSGGSCGVCAEVRGGGMEKRRTVWRVGAWGRRS